MKNKQLKQFSTMIAVLFAFAPLAHAEISVGADAGMPSGGMHMEMDEKVDVRGAQPMEKNVSGVRMEGGVNTAGGMKMEDGMDTMEQKDGHSGESRGENEDSEDGSMHMKMNMHATGTMRAGEMADEHALEGLEKAELHIELGESEEGGTEEAESAEMDSSMKVHSSHDFEHFVMHKAKDDKHLKNVEVAGGKMEVTYEEPAKLFGFFGTTINAHASVDAKDNVEVSYPWYHIFMKKQVAKESLQSDIARAIAAERKAQKEGMATTTVEAKIEASLGIPNLFEIIANALKNSSVKTEAEAGAK